MPTPRLCGLVLILLALALGGCDDSRSMMAPSAKPAPTVLVPGGLSGTVSEYAVLVGSEDLVVKGYGVVVGLGTKGSGEVPEGLHRYLVHQMATLGVGTYATGTAMISPSRILSDKDTAVVVVGGRIPPAAPAGTRFDIHIESLPQTQTLSLSGGYLMGTELRLNANVTVAAFGDIKSWAMAHGPVFVNDFADTSSRPDEGRLKIGSIPNGGVVTTQRPVRLELRRSDYTLATMTQQKINQRFGGGMKMAWARSPSLVELNIPDDLRGDYEHFLQLVMHLYLIGGSGGEEMHARQLARAILLPTAMPDDISLVWEAMGRQILPVIRDSYTSSNSTAAFYACRAGLRLEDVMAVEPMGRLAQVADNPFQLQAIAEIGRARRMVQFKPILKALLSDRNELVRIAAYEAVCRHGLAGLVRRTEVPGQFIMDEVDTDGEFTIYATVSGQPRIVLFGRGMPVNRPVFYSPSDELITINARGVEDDLTAYRRLPRGNAVSDSFRIRAQVVDLVTTLATTPERHAAPENTTQPRLGTALHVTTVTTSPAYPPVPGSAIEVTGMGLTYSQVLGVLNGLCKNGAIPAKFVLQRPPNIQKIYLNAGGAERPETPEDRR